MSLGKYIEIFMDELYAEAERRGITPEEYYHELMIQYNDMVMKRNIDNIKKVILEKSKDERT